MTISTLPLHRRTRVERSVLALLRGDYSPGIQADHGEAFDRLRALATAHDLLIAPTGTPYLSASEQMLLSWIADAQRVASTRRLPDDGEVQAAIRHCACILIEIRLRLSALSLYSEGRTAPPLNAGRIRPVR